MRFDATPDEAWTTEPRELFPWYDAAQEFALKNLAGGRECLVIGSPPKEAVALKNAGWHVTYLDVRQPPPLAVDRVVIGDACALPFAIRSFGVLSSTCVLCHVGLGRYGDPVRQDGDRMALTEMHRVLKPGGKASVMFGPSMPVFSRTFAYGTTHRFYNKGEAEEMARQSGFRILKSVLWLHRWLTEEDVDRYFADTMNGILGMERYVIHHCYLQMLLEKPQ